MLQKQTFIDWRIFSFPILINEQIIPTVFWLGTILIVLAIPWKWASDINIVRSKINLESEKKVPVYICETSRFERVAKRMWSSSRYKNIWKWIQEVCYRVSCQRISHLHYKETPFLQSCTGNFLSPCRLKIDGVRDEGTLNVLWHETEEQNRICWKRQNTQFVLLPVL